MQPVFKLPCCTDREQTKSFQLLKWCISPDFCEDLSWKLWWKFTETSLILLDLIWIHASSTDENMLWIFCLSLETIIKLKINNLLIFRERRLFIICLPSGTILPFYDHGWWQSSWGNQYITRDLKSECLQPLQWGKEWGLSGCSEVWNFFMFQCRKCLKHLDTMLDMASKFFTW